MYLVVQQTKFPWARPSSVVVSRWGKDPAAVLLLLKQLWNGCWHPMRKGVEIADETAWHSISYRVFVPLVVSIMCFNPKWAFWRWGILESGSVEILRLIWWTELPSQHDRLELHACVVQCLTQIMATTTGKSSLLLILTSARMWAKEGGISNVSCKPKPCRHMTQRC